MRSTGPRRPLTAAEYGQLPGCEDFELAAGQLVEVPAPGALHAEVHANLAALVAQHVAETGIGSGCVRAAYVLARSPDTVLRPDVSFVRAEREPEAAEGDLYDIAPDLAAEVVDGHDHAEALLERVATYLAAGTKVVWLVYPAMRQVHIYRPGWGVRVVTGDGKVDGGEVLTGFEVTLNELWD